MLWRNGNICNFHAITFQLNTKIKNENIIFYDLTLEKLGAETKLNFAQDANSNAVEQRCTTLLSGL